MTRYDIAKFYGYNSPEEYEEAQRRLHESYVRSKKMQKPNVEKEPVKIQGTQEKKYCRMIPLEPDCRGYTDVFICTNCHQHIHLGFIRKEYIGSYCLECGAEVKDGDDVLYYDIGNMPAEDVQPVKRGKWEKKRGYLVCSNCGMAVDTIGYTYEEQEEVFRYCSCCGYRMDGDTE